MTQKYSITLLPGDGIGPEIMEVAVDVLKLIGKQFNLNFQFETALIGGAAIDETGEPLPSHTLETCGRSDANSPIYGMPILEVDRARQTIVIKRGMSKGFAGVDNELFYKEKTTMLFGSAKDMVAKLVSEVKQL